MSTVSCLQVHIRADVLTKTVGKSRNDKKSCVGGGAFQKAHRKKTAAADESKECFSENDLRCSGDGGYDHDYDYEYEDDEDEVDDDEDDGDNEYDDDVFEDDRDSEDVRRGGRASRGVEAQTNGSAAAAAADHCDNRRHRSRRRGNNRTALAQGGGRREPKTMGGGRQRHGSHDKTDAAVNQVSAVTDAAATDRDAFAADVAGTEATQTSDVFGGDGNGHPSEPPGEVLGDGHGDATAE